MKFSALVLGIETGEQLLWCFAIGFMVACVYAFCVKCFTGRLVRALVREEAQDEASALTLAQISCSGFLYRFALRGGSTLSRSVVVADPKEAEKRYYILPEEKDKLLSKYGADAGSLLSLVLTLLAAFIAAVIGSALLPVVTEWLGL